MKLILILLCSMTFWMCSAQTYNTSPSEKYIAYEVSNVRLSTKYFARALTQVDRSNRKICDSCYTVSNFPAGEFIADTSNITLATVINAVMKYLLHHKVKLNAHTVFPCEGNKALVCVFEQSAEGIIFSGKVWPMKKVILASKAHHIELIKFY